MMSDELTEIFSNYPTRTKIKLTVFSSHQARRQGITKGGQIF